MDEISFFYKRKNELTIPSSCQMIKKDHEHYDTDCDWCDRTIYYFSVFLVETASCLHAIYSAAAMFQSIDLVHLHEVQSQSLHRYCAKTQHIHPK